MVTTVHGEFGYCTEITTSFNEWDHPVQGYFLDEFDQPTNAADGVHCWTVVRDENGNIVSWWAWGIDGVVVDPTKILQ